MLMFGVVVREWLKLKFKLLKCCWQVVMVIDCCVTIGNVSKVVVVPFRCRRVQFQIPPPYTTAKHNHPSLLGNPFRRDVIRHYTHSNRIFQKHLHNYSLTISSSAFLLSKFFTERRNVETQTQNHLKYSNTTFNTSHLTYHLLPP